MKTRIVLFTLLSIIAISCRNKGCIDPLSPDFDERAIKDDNSCTYDGRLIFWFDENTKDNLEVFGVNELRIRTDGSFAGTIELSEWVNQQPACNSMDGFRQAIATNGEDSKVVAYEVEDDLGFMITSGMITVPNSECVWIEVVF